MATKYAAEPGGREEIEQNEHGHDKPTAREISVNIDPSAEPVSTRHRHISPS